MNLPKDIIEAFPDGVLLVRQDWHMAYYNRQFVKMWGIPQEMKQNRDDQKSLKSVFAKLVDPQSFNKRLDFLMNNPLEATRDELELVDGRSLECFSRVINDESGQYYGRIWFFRDITQRRKEEQEKIENERRLNDLEKIDSLRKLAGGVAHKFNNILTALSVNLELAQIQGALPPQVATFIERSRKSLSKAVEVSHAMLDYLGLFTDDKEIVKGREFFSRLGEYVFSDLPDTIACEIAPVDGGIYFNCNRERVRQAVMELIENSVESMKDTGGNIKLACKTAWALDEHDYGAIYEGRPIQGPFVKITVEDDGEGIRQPDLSRIFDPYYTTKFTGRGMGLSLALGVACFHGGTMAVDSIQGKGTRVSMYLAAEEIGEERAGALSNPSLPL